MSGRADNNIEMLRNFGLNEDEAGLYHYLCKNGSSTALLISRQIHVGRTKVYRMLDKLIELGLAEQIVESRGFMFRATDFSRLKTIITEKKLQLQNAEAMLPDLIESLKPDMAEDKKQRVVYLKGEDVYKQVTWNSLKAKGKLFIFEMVSDMSSLMDRSFAEEVRRELVKRRIHVHQITNFKHLEHYTDVTELVEKYWDVKYIDPKVLNLSYEVLIYNDVVAMYNLRGKDVFCVEVHDANLAAMQKQLFAYIWRTAQPMVKVGSHGEARLE